MKKILIYILPLFFVLIAMTSNSYAVTLQGKVLYDTINTPVSSGYVKALFLNSVTFELSKVDSVNIGGNGSYIFVNIPTGQNIYIIAYPATSLDYVPCYYPAGTNWQEAIIVNTSSSQNNLDIKVRKLYNTVHVGIISGNVSHSNGLPLNDAIVYLESYKGELISFGVTNANGNYSIPNAPEGEYALTSNRIAFVNNSVFGIKMNYSFFTHLPNQNFSLKQIVSISQIGTIVPSKYSLYQNYPNPFNPTTKIKFDVPKSGNAVITVYNSQGKMMKEIINQFIPSGSFEVSLDGKDLSSGVYYYRMDINGFSVSKKMMLVK